jgi:hypothetical protein
MVGHLPLEQVILVRIQVPQQMKKIEKIDRIYTVFAISRSGHHPIVDWIYDSCKSPKVFFNDPDLKDPIRKRAFYYLDKQKYYHLKNQLKHQNSSRDSQIRIKERINNFKKAGWILEEENPFKNSLQIKNLIVNFENYNPLKSSKEIRSCINTISEYTKENIAVIIIRNPFNLIASRIMHGRPITKDEKRQQKINPNEFLNLWKSYNEIIKNKLKLEGFSKTIIIKYEDWCNSKSKKELYSKNLKLERLLLISNKMSPFGGGSSFNGFHKKAKELKTDNRWLELIQNMDPEVKDKKQIFIKFFKKHPEMSKVSKTIYNKIIKM